MQPSRLPKRGYRHLDAERLEELGDRGQRRSAPARRVDRPTGHGPRPPVSGGVGCGATSSEVLAGLVPGARVVKAANTLGAAVLGSDPHEGGGRRVIVLSGDDADAKSAVTALFEDAGFAAIDLGGLVTGGAMQQFGGPLSGVNLIQLSQAT